MANDDPFYAPAAPPTTRTPRQAQQAKVLGQAAAALQLLAVVFNLLTAAMWALSLIWIGIGLFWVLLMGVLVWEAVGAVDLLRSGRRSPWGAAAGMAVSLLNFNLVTLLMEGLALGLLLTAGRAEPEE